MGQDSEVMVAPNFRCCDCKHHLRVRAEMHKVICSVTLEFKDRENIASCEYADRQDADNKAMPKLLTA